MTTSTDVLILDPSALTLARTGQTVTVTLPGGEIISTVVVPDGLGRRAAVAHVLDRILDGRVGVTRTLLEDGTARVVRFRVGLYNPYTAQIAVKPLVQTRVFRVGRLLALDPDGTVASWDENRDVLRLAGVELTVEEPGYAAAAAAIEAHRNACPAAA